MQSSSNPLVEDYTEVFYMIDEGDIPSVQCKMSLRGPKSMREVDGPSFIFIDFNVPALTPRLNRIQITLRFSKNITLFAIRGIHSSVIDKEDQINTWCLGRVSFM
jgi:hypothetical protein